MECKCQVRYPFSSLIYLPINGRAEDVKGLKKTETV